LNAIDLPELITENKKDYENLIFGLATNRHKLMKIKEKLSVNRMSKPLFDSKQYTQHLEIGYEQAYINHISGLKPNTIYIKN
jgi:protein O-GlcNAc transferase